MTMGPAALALVLTLSAAGSDPRVPLVELQLKSDHESALERVEAELAQNPEAARRLGLDYLRGHLLLLLDRRSEAFEAFANAMNSTPSLGPYGRFRLAVEQERAGHPEVAAGLVATLLGANPPQRLIGPAAVLLRRTLAAGGDCRLLRGLLAKRFRTRDLRQLRFAEAECLRRGRDTEGATLRLVDLLEADRSDEVARLAAARLAENPSAERPARTDLLVGLSFYEHREFDRALAHLGRAFEEPLDPGISAREIFEGRYAIARSHFWEARFRRAAAAFAELAAATRDLRRRSQVLYQEARSHELAGDWERAIEAFRRTYETEPSGRYSNAALVAYLRLEWLRGEEVAALEIFDEMAAKRRNSTVARAALFLASSELAQGRGERAGDWLAQARRLGGLAPQELAYWQGRFEETRGRLDRALENYLEVLRGDPYHPLAGGARRRLAQPALAALARTVGRRLAGSDRADELYGAWLLLGPGEERGRAARTELETKIAEDRAAAAYLDLAAAPAAGWPLWSAPLGQPEEMLLALGIWREGAPVVLRHFPVAEPRLAYTGSLILAQAGETNRSLYVAEVLNKRVPERLGADLLPESYRRLLYPFRYSYLILRESHRREIDPYLLAAIIREESRFDPEAFSAASARGLTQFVLPTARRIAAKIGLGELEAQDLHRPEVSIALGAAYLEELLEHFEGENVPAIAAYNAGEPQAELWRRYCQSGESEEYLAKVAFRETRGYLTKVLTSRAHYFDLYGTETPPPP